MKLSNSACNGQKLLLVSSCTVTAPSELMFTAPRSAATSDMFWDLAGSCCLQEYHGQRLFEQVMHDEFSKTTTALRNAYPLGWKRISMWTDRMQLDRLQDPELADACTFAQLFSNCYFFPKGFQVTFSIAEVGLL